MTRSRWSVARDYTAIALRYCRSVASHATPAPIRIRQACYRHLSDLERAKESGYPYRYSRAAAASVCLFAESLVHIKGEWARQKPGIEAPYLHLEPWECFLLCIGFGWLRRSDGSRRFREFFWFIPRKNGKSTLGAIVGLYMFCADGEPGPEVYSGATTEPQAWEVFGPALQMAKSSPGLIEDASLVVGAKALGIQGGSGKFKPIIGKPGDGASPHAALIDEYHEHSTAEQYDTMKTGMGARRHALMCVITTAGDNLAGPCKLLYDYSCNVLDGTFQDDQLFAAIWEADKDDDWTDFGVWRKANPNVGISVSEDFLRHQLAVAMQDASKQGVVQTKHLNMWVSTRHRFFNPLEWASCADRELCVSQFGGKDCWVGIDLASKVDIADVVVLFQELRGTERHIFVFARHYLPSATVERPENEHYRTWRAQGRLRVTDGDVIDFQQIEQDIIDFARTVVQQEIGFDPWQATELSTRLAAEGLRMVEVRPSVQSFSEPMKELEALIKTRRVHHDGDPVLSWMVSNVVAKLDNKDNVYPCKERGADKIDGVVALLMALNLAMRNPPKGPCSIDWC